MATYNGAPYVREQVTSIEAQTLTDWRLLIRDDGSTDCTLEILGDLARQEDRIELIQDMGKPPLGAAQNFGRLLQWGLETESDLFFLCDQDDVWESNKLARQVARFPKAGNERGPVLVHSDLAVVDDSLQPIHPSLIGHMALEPAPEGPLNYLLTRNFVTGCATACNRRLLEEALPISNGAIMHDWWLAAVAAATGEIWYIPEALVRYRQHASNTQGVKGFWHGLNPAKNWIRGWRAGNKEFLATFSQIKALYDHGQLRGSWPQVHIELMRQYSQLMILSRSKRSRAARRLNLRQGNALLQLIYYLRLITVK